MDNHGIIDRVLESKDAEGKEQESHGKEPKQANEEPTPEEEPEEEQEKDEVKTEESLISELKENVWKFVKELKVFLYFNSNILPFQTYHHLCVSISGGVKFQRSMWKL